jgi:hypothetical protein
MVVSINTSLMQAFKDNVKVKNRIKKAHKQVKQTKAKQRKTEKSNNNLKNEVEKLKANGNLNQAEDKSKNQKIYKEDVKVIEKVNDKTESKVQTQNKQPAKEEVPITKSEKSKKKASEKMELSDIGDVENNGTSLNKAVGSHIVSLLKEAMQDNNQEETKHKPAKPVEIVQDNNQKETKDNPTKQQSDILNAFKNNTSEGSKHSKHEVPNPVSVNQVNTSTQR